MNERSADLYGVVGIDQNGNVLVNENFFRMDCWSHPFNQRLAYLWLCWRTPVKARYSIIAREWMWKPEQARRFIYQLSGAGLVRFVHGAIEGIAISNAVPKASNDSWTELRAFILARDNFCCVYCGSTDDIHCDHVHPRSRGGVDHAANLVTSCASCNLSKGAKLLSEWQGRAGK
jgi:hypothetical protein